MSDLLQGIIELKLTNIWWNRQQKDRQQMQAHKGLNRLIDLVTINVAATNIDKTTFEINTIAHITNFCANSKTMLELSFS